MELYHFDKPLTSFNPQWTQGTILLLGEFEFFHKGHQSLLLKAQEINQSQKLPIGIFILDQKQKQMVQSLDDRLYQLALNQFDFVIVAQFDVAFKNLSGQDFLQYLTTTYQVKHLIAGSDFAFGKDRQYQAQQMQELVNPAIEVHVCDLKQHQNQKIASRHLKQMFMFGEFNLIKELIPQPLVFHVQLHQEKIVWTANLVKPHSGIYYFKILINEHFYHGLIHFSMNGLINFQLVNQPAEMPIFNANSLVMLLDLERIIISKRFDKIMNQDIEAAKAFFSLKDDHEN